MKRTIPLIFMLILITSDVIAQRAVSGAGFISPVDFKLALSGTFGELRTDHFHSGIDIKTWGVRGKPLHAISDGYVSRIAVSGEGLGKAIYVKHPNGYTSVYAHCRNFRKDIDNYVRAEQYQRESFEVNLFPTPDKFPVQHGDIIAYSGNSGRSFGPHLHFEIRRTEGQKPLNPLAFGMPVKDFVRPTFQRIMIYPYGNFSFVNRVNEPCEYATTGWGPDCGIENGDTVEISGQAYFGVEAYDVLNESKNRNGIYAMEVYIDSVLKYSHAMDEFSFSESRYINSLIDYAYFAENGRRLQKTRIDPNNKLSVYQVRENDGVFDFIDNRLHRVLIVIRDFHGNESLLRFYVQSIPPALENVLKNGNHMSPDLVFDWERPNEFRSEDVKLYIPEGALYDTVHFVFSTSPAMEDCCTEIFHVHRKSTPLHRDCRLSVRAENIPPKHKSQALIVMLDDVEYQAAGGEWEDDIWMSAEVRSFGDYTVVLDTMPPEVRPQNIYPGKNISTQQAISIKAMDDIAGIESYRATMNGQWILMESDPKNDLLIYKIDDRTLPGVNKFRLTVTDERENETFYEATLIR